MAHMSLDIKKSCSFQIFISLTTVVQSRYCHLKKSCSPDVVMVCFGLTRHPPPIYQSQRQ